LYGITFELFPDYLKLVKPKGFIAEQEMGFGRADPADDRGFSFMQKFGFLASSAGYSVRVLELNSGVFCEADGPRPA
jgi:hypothetical protein